MINKTNILFVGIDPSMNSSGICLRVFNPSENKIINEEFYIIKNNKLTKRETEAEFSLIKESIKFSYILVNKNINSEDSNSVQECNKTKYFLSIVDEIKEAIKKIYSYYDCIKCFICLEGISYGSSIKTKSIFDLAGLNYIIRSQLLGKNFSGYTIELYIGTPQEIKKYSTGMGNASKDIIIESFKNIYPNFNIPKIDDIADAYFMSKYAEYIYMKDHH